MDFPEVVFGNQCSLQDAISFIEKLMLDDKEMAQRIASLSKGLNETYKALEPYFVEYTESICKECDHPCCVNRHGFPDFEDLIVLAAMGHHIPSFDFSAQDTSPCQFLGKEGCTLKRCYRSYRCTWYFCDEVFDSFEARDKAAYKRFDSLMTSLCQKRQEIIRLFELSCRKYLRK